ncbi:MAG: gamma-butyrobetaine,2-oxoglutarate dioxygenase [Ilumatobacter sp.]|nr:gamma-butyrobetaine,2-oxoglutarate dioxygenase [Ilumatobacter sp.]
MAEDVLTPDFASYPWTPLERVEFSRHVVVHWADGSALDCHPLWLFENTVAVDPVTREATVDPGDLPPAESLRAAERRADGALVLTWADGRESVAHPGWLRSIAAGEHLPSFVPGPPVVWTAGLGEPPTFDGSHVLDDEAEFEAWLGAMCSFGLARLRRTRADRSLLEELARRIGPVRGSNFGGIFTVEAKLDADSTANTGLNLGQHTDLPTRETPPGFQFLHCVENTVAGGASRMTDGLAVVAELEAHHPAEYGALTTLQWVFANRARDGDHRWIGPIIDHGAPSSPLTLRAFYPVRLAPHMPAEDVERGYSALRVFSRIAHDPRFMIRNRFERGDLVGFDNRRVLHGRDEFDSGGGHRVLMGCYIDRDDVFSRLRVLRRRHEASGSDHPTADHPTRGEQAT